MTNVMRIVPTLILIFLLLLGVPYALNALELQPNSKAPIEILSDEVRYLNIEGKAIFTGNVVATQDDIIVKSKSMEVLFDKSNETKVKTDTKTNVQNGGISIIYFKDNVDITTKNDHATAKNGEYDVKKGIFTLKGDVRLEQAGNVLTGDELIYIKNTGETLLKSKAGARVKAHIIQKHGTRMSSENEKRR